MLSVGFVLPQDEQNFKPFRNQPLVGLYLLTIIEEAFGDKVDISVIDLRGIPTDHLSYYLPEKDLYLYSVFTPEYFVITRARDCLRRVYPKSRHIAGGPHINIIGEPSLADFDTIVLGEGEDVIVQIIQDALDNKLKSIYRQNTPVVLDAYPYAQRHYIPRESVADKGLLNKPNHDLLGTTVIFSRGCPFLCHFCANVNFGPARFRSSNLIKAEIEYLKKEYGVGALALKDDNSIPTNRHIARPFLEAIGSCNVRWRGQSRANGITEEMVKLAAQSGCTDIAIGIESASPTVLKIINKKINLDKAKKYIHCLQDNGIEARLHFILGLPGETEDIVEQTLKFIDEADPQSVLLSLFCPIPGSKITENPEEFGMRIGDKSWDRYRFAFGRFDSDELPELMFDYEKTTPFGDGLPTEQILKNYTYIQNTLRERGKNF